MEKDRKIKIVAVASVLVAIIGLSIAFAALSQTLSINGTAKQESSNWQVVWEKISGEDFVTTGTAEVQDNYPTLTENDTNLNLGIITLKKPGDKVTYRVNMANKGTIDAKVTGVTGVSLDNTYVSYSVKYLDNNIDITAANGRLLAANQRKMVLIEVKFKESVTTEEFNQIPSEGIEISLNGVAITYEQNDGTGMAADPSSQSENNCTEFTKKDTYNVGDVIAICNETTGKSEDFYVMSDNGSTVTAMAKYNLLVGDKITLTDDFNIISKTAFTASDPGYGLQSSSTIPDDENSIYTGVISFSEGEEGDVGYWAETTETYPSFVYNSQSNLWTPVQNYQAYLRSLGKSSVTASVPSYEQLTILGCDEDKEESCMAAPSWVYSTDYWFGSAFDNKTVYGVASDSYFQYNSFFHDRSPGIRPVITINKSEL